MAYAKSLIKTWKKFVPESSEKKEKKREERKEQQKGEEQNGGAKAKDLGKSFPPK